MAHVDVLLPVKNSASTIGEAIESILQQSLRDFRLFVIDDGSTDATPDLIKTYTEKDRRVEMLRNSGRGIVDALNFGLSRATAPFIARMDGDDISAPLRLERQIGFLEANPSYAAVGTRIECFGTKSGSPQMILSPDGCRTALCLYTPICHPTVVMRRDAIMKLDHPYTKEFPHAEDYDLFTRLVAVGEIGNLDDQLLRYREHAGQVSSQNRATQRECSFSIASRYMARQYGVDTSSKARILTTMLLKAFQLGPAHARESARAIKGALQVNFA